ncbi:unnamed protein product, partial [Medioppia subpectinata]
MSGRFPLSDTTDEFAKNLFEGVDMVTKDDSRWPLVSSDFAPIFHRCDEFSNNSTCLNLGLFDTSNRMGKIHSYQNFDSGFFGLMGQTVTEMDPQLRLLLEVSYEAILDSVTASAPSTCEFYNCGTTGSTINSSKVQLLEGVNPQLLRGSNTGVYVGATSNKACDGYPDYMQADVDGSLDLIMHQTMFSSKYFYPNRISFANDFKGPSLLVDTACSSSLSAMTMAYNDLMLGNTDAAVVCGTHMVFEPFVNQIQEEYGICSPRGVSAVLDESADGYVKSEAVCCLFLQRHKDARRVYAEVMSARVNVDGKKKMGMFYPSADAQEQLMIQSYKIAEIDPARLTYFEAHATGTKVGDLQEIKAIYNAYCENRTEPLPLGVLKSNMGHSEAASGIPSVVKVLIAYENECIPPNINFNKLKGELERYFPPLLVQSYEIMISRHTLFSYRPITESHPKPRIEKHYEKCVMSVIGLAAVNNFGLGGANAHVLLEPNPKVGTSDGFLIAETIPRIVNICGRTEDAVKYVMDFIQNNPKRVTNDFLALLAPIMRTTPDVNSSGMPFRGSIIIKKMSETNNEIKYKYNRQMGVIKGKIVRPLWILFPGLGGQWPAMAKALMPIKIFADKVEECHQILHEFGVDLKHMLLSENKTSMASITSKFCSTTAIEIALFEVMKALDITPDGIIGHSFGEIACAYADGCLTTRDAMVVTYFRGAITENDKKIPKGLMAVIGLSSDEAINVCPKGVYVVCNNAKDSVVCSGSMNEMKSLINTVTKNRVFVRQLESSEIPFHTKYLITSAKPLTDAIKKYILNPRFRSQKWVSTSLMTTDPDDPALKYASAEYFVYNLLNPVQFYDRLKDLPSDAIVLELGPHSVFGKIVTETLNKCIYVSLIKKDSNHTNLGTLFNGLAKLYEAGVNMSVENLYTKVEWPVVRNTQSISSIIRWEHKQQIPFSLYPKKYDRSTASDYNYTFDPVNYQKNKFYLEHCVDGKAIFPAVGYITLAWRRLATGLGRHWYDVPVVFENVQFKRPVFLKDSAKTVFTVRYFAATDDFCVLESDNVCVVGKIRAPDHEVLLTPNAILERQNMMASILNSLDKEDIYKKIRVLGLDYGPHFQRLKSIQTNDFCDIYGINEWNGNLVTYLDAMLQAMIFLNSNRLLEVPVMMRAGRCDPRILFNALRVRHKLNRHDDDTSKRLSKLGSVISDNDSAQYHRELNNETDRFNRRFCIFSAEMPFYFDRKTKRLVAHGLEIDGLITQPISRRKEVENLVLESAGAVPVPLKFTTFSAGAIKRAVSAGGVGGSNSAGADRASPYILCVIN